MLRSRVTVLTDGQEAVRRAFALFTEPLGMAALHAPARSCETGCYVARVGLPNATLEFVSVPALARARRLLGLPTHGMVAQVAHERVASGLADGSDGSGASAAMSSSPAALRSLLRAYASPAWWSAALLHREPPAPPPWLDLEQDDDSGGAPPPMPPMPPTARDAANADGGGEGGGVLRLRELVLSTAALSSGERSALTRSVVAASGGERADGCANVWWLGGCGGGGGAPLGVRLAHVRAPSLVLQVGSIAAARDALENHAAAPVRCSVIGANGRDRVGQLLMRTPWQSGLNLRLCEHQHCSPAFSEGTDALLEVSWESATRGAALGRGGTEGAGRAAQSGGGGVVALPHSAFRVPRSASGGDRTAD